MSSFEQEIEKKTLPSGINVLTILTFIGGGIGILSGIYSYLKSEENLTKMQEMMSKPEFSKMPDFAKKFYSPEAMDLLQKMVENKLPVLVITLVGSILCVYGAIEMRKLKISGLYTYIIGAVVPYIGMLIFIGTAMYSGGITSFIGIGISLLFIVLFWLQKKYLIN